MKVVFISDTHGKHKELDFSDKIYDNIDTIVHSGDFSHNLNQFYEFMNWYSETPFKNKILIPGNHETVLEHNQSMFFLTCKELGIHGLIDNEVVIDGIKFYGTPWTPMFYNWAWMEEDYLLDKHWDKIPKDTNVLITHGPRYGILDKVWGYRNNNYCQFSVGSETLGDAVDTLKELKIHTCGHIHESAGIIVKKGVIYINASSVDANYKVLPPVIQEIK